MRYTIAIAALLLAGCSWSDVLIAEVKSVPPGSSFGYQEGYGAGCKSGLAEKGGFGFDKPVLTRDELRIRTEGDYKKGWDDGAAGCSKKYAGMKAPYYPPGR
jgi:hypothetical protein